MAKLQIKLAAEMENGTTHEVVADQRDVAAWEAHTNGWDIATHAHMAARFLTWHALNRTKKTAMNWERFNSLLIEAAYSEDEDDDSPLDSPNPGSQEQ